MKMLEPPGERYRVTVLLQRIVCKWEFLKYFPANAQKTVLSGRSGKLFSKARRLV